MKNWKLTTAVIATATVTAVFAIINSTDAEQNKDEKDVKKAATIPAPAAPAAPEANENPWDFLPDVVATYGNQKISKDEFIKTVEEIISSSPGAKQNMNGGMIKAIAPRIVDTMISKHILLGEAEKNGFKPSPELVSSEFDEMAKNVPAKETEQFKKVLESQGTNFDEYKKKLSENKVAQEEAAISIWIKQKIAPQTTVSDEEVKKYFDENQATFTKPESLNASHILIKPADESPEKDAEAKKKCEQIKKDIDSGKLTFEAAAVENSDCPSGKSANGSLGEFRHGDMVKEFDEAASAMKIGEMSGPVKTKFGYHLIRLDGKNEKSASSFDDVKVKIKEYLAQQKTNDILKDLIAKKKTELNVKINI